MAEPTIAQAKVAYNGSSGNAAIAIELNPATTKGVILCAFNYSAETGGAKYLDGGVADPGYGDAQWRPFGNGTSTKTGIVLKGHRSGNFANYVQYWKGSELVASSGAGEIRWWWGDGSGLGDRTPARQICAVIEITGDFDEDIFDSWVENTDFKSILLQNVQNPSDSIGSASGNRALDWICGAVSLNTFWTADGGQTVHDSLHHTGSQTGGIVTSESGAATSTLSYTGTDTSYTGFHVLFDLHPASGTETVNATDGAHAHAADNVTLVSNVTPTGFTAVPQPNGDVRLSWTDQSGGTLQHTVWRKTTGAWFQVATLDPGASTYDDPTAASNTLYTYRVCALSSPIQCSATVLVLMVAIADGAHAHAADQMTAEAGLLGADGVHAHQADQCVIVEGQESIVPHDAGHAHAADAGSVSPYLLIAESVHPLTSDSVNFYDVVPDRALHVHIVDGGVSFSAWSPGTETGAWAPETSPAGAWIKLIETGTWS